MTITTTIRRLPPTDTGRCGENAGHERHRQRGEQPCEPCRRAKNAYQATWRLQRHERVSYDDQRAARSALPLTSGAVAGRGVWHEFRPMLGQAVGTLCGACWGWRDDPRHPVLGGPVVGR